MKKARVSVQFQSVTEKLSPYDTIFSFTQPADLRDSALSSACSLHTATASIKSSNDSLPQRGLAGITEDALESRINTVKGGVVHGSTARDEEQFSDAEDAQIRHEKVNGSSSADRTHHRSTSASTQSSFRPRTTSNTDKPLPPPPPEDDTREEISPSSITDHGDYNKRPSMDGRFSSNSTRPSTRDLYDAYGYKIKAKIGPRPSTDPVGVPNSLDSRANEFRPVSTLPAGLRMPSRKAVPARQASRPAHASSPTRISSPVTSSPPAQANSVDKMTPKTAPTAPVVPVRIPDRSMPSSGLRTPKILEPGSPKMTPEKQRLMKALQLRQKQVTARNSVNSADIRNGELEFTKPEIDESILCAVIDASSSTEGSEPVQITTEDIAKEGSRYLEDSPISMPETVEEPSTQASSITDEEEAAAQRRKENRPTSIPIISEHHVLVSDALAEKPHPQLIGSQEVALAPEDSKRNALTKAASVESLKGSNQPSAPTQSHFFSADRDVADQKAVEKVSPKSGQTDQSTVMDGQSGNDENSMTAKELYGDKQLWPSLFLEHKSPKDQPTAVDGPPSIDQKIKSTAEINEKRGVQQFEPLEVHSKAAYTGQASDKKGILQSHSLEDDKRVSLPPNTDDHAPVLQSQFEEGSRQSLENPAWSSDEFVSQEAQNDVVKPLLVRRSSTSKSITVPSDNVNAHEVPLPPIDEDEEISLSPQRALFREQAATHPPLDTDGEPEVATLHAEVPSQDNDNSITRSTSSNLVCESQTERQLPRQGVVNSIKRVSSPDRLDEHFLSDDSFMEELKSATMQEAKPVSVSKSPIKPVFSRSESEQRLNGSARNSRSVSTPVNHSAKDEEVFSSPGVPTPLSTYRSSSAQHAPFPDPQQSQVPISKKVGVSSSISQRIKALEQLSSRPTSPISSNLAPNTSNFLGLRNTSLRTPSGGADYKSTNLNKIRPGTAHPSPSPSPETVNSSFFNHPNKADFSRPVKSVSATIVRHARNNKSPETPSNPPEPRRLDLQESIPQREIQKSPPPAVHKTMGPPPLSPLKPPRPRFGRYSSTRSGSSSSNEQKLEPPPTTRRDSFASIRSKSSRAGSEVELPRTLSDSSLSGVASLDGTQDEKKDSRRSRLLKRMSSISSMSRRSIAHALSPGPKEAPIIERQEPVQEALSTSLDIGDVNVQFPDNLVSSAFNLLLTSTNIVSSFGRDDT